VPLVKDGMNTPRLSSVEVRVQASASREAANQLLRVSWRTFRRAYEEYPRWQALALWGEAVIGMKGHTPSSVLTTLKKHCPGFIEARRRSQQFEPLALRLLEWAHTKRFRNAKEQSWLDALIFYGVRHPLSRGAWAYWEHCEKEWDRKRPAPFPSFGRWWHSALQWPLCDGANCAAVAAAVERYIDWEALRLWLRPLFFNGIGLPPHALSELERRCPGISNLDDSGTPGGGEARSSMSRRIMGAGNDHFLSRARQEGWFGNLLEQVRSHPWHVRMHAYAARWNKEWTRSPALPYPSLRRWQQAAASYIKPGGTPPSGLRGSAKPSARTS
jgi:hypothetical protein